MTDINLNYDFLSKQELETLNNYLRINAPWEITQDHWSGRFINFQTINDSDISTLVQTIANRVKDVVENHENTSVDIETLQLVRWRPGDKLDPPHADAEHLDGSPHPYSNRHYSALIYLNNDFMGGEIFFPNQNFTPVIAPGMLVNFTGTLKHLHGVTEVTSGLRYTMVMFFTRSVYD